MNCIMPFIYIPPMISLISLDLIYVFFLTFILLGEKCLLVNISHSHFPSRIFRDTINEISMTVY